MNLNSEKALYLQVVDLIENEILRERLGENQQAPSTNDFAKIYKINPATARKGLNILVEEGILYKKRGMGMFVKEGARQIVLRKRQEEFFKEILPNTIKEAKRLEIGLEEIRTYMEKWRDD